NDGGLAPGYGLAQVAPRSVSPGQELQQRTDARGEWPPQSPALQIAFQRELSGPASRPDQAEQDEHVAARQKAQAGDVGAVVLFGAVRPRIAEVERTGENAVDTQPLGTMPVQRTADFAIAADVAEMLDVPFEIEAEDQIVAAGGHPKAFVVPDNVVDIGAGRMTDRAQHIPG